MHNRNNTNKGFTLIELLIVIAIIGILAATVVISIGSQTDTASDASVEVAVAAGRTVATGAFASGDQGSNICNKALEGLTTPDKDDWTWSAPSTANPNGVMCARNTLIDADSIVAGMEGHICCFANGNDWVIWGGLSDADGFGDNNAGTTADTSTPIPDGDDIFCTDSTGFIGEVDLAETINNLGVSNNADCQ